MIQGVLFDMDGVLLDSERITRQELLALSGELGYSFSEELYSRILGVTAEKGRQITQEALGADFPYRSLLAQCEENLKQAVIQGRMPLKEGLAECFAGLRARRIRMALATSTDRDTVNIYLHHIPQMREAFDAVVCGAEGGRSKPAPDIYLKAAEALNLAPSQCAGVEDSPNGIQSLRAAGVYSIMIPDLIACPEALRPCVDSFLASLQEVCPLIDRLNGEASSQ